MTTFWLTETLNVSAIDALIEGHIMRHNIVTDPEKLKCIKALIGAIKALLVEALPSPKKKARVGRPAATKDTR